jgi:Domain of unknown function (DUF4296)
MRTCILILLSGIILSSCSNKNALPDNVLKPAKMQAVLWDIIRVDAFTTNFIKKDSTKNAVAENVKLQKQVFATHKVTEEAFYESYSYYKKNTALFKSVMDSMINIANRKRNIRTSPLN